MQEAMPSLKRPTAMFASELQAVLFPVCGRLKYVVIDNWRMRRRKRERMGFGGATSAANSLIYLMSRESSIDGSGYGSIAVVLSGSSPASAAVKDEQVCKSGKKLVLPRSVVRGLGSGGSFHKRAELDGERGRDVGKFQTVSLLSLDVIPMRQQPAVATRVKIGTSLTGGYGDWYPESEGKRVLAERCNRRAKIVVNRCG